MGCYYTLYLNTYGYSLLFYKVYREEGECRQLEFWLEKEQTLETYSTLLQKSWNSMKLIFGINKNYWAEETPQGAHTLAKRVGGAPIPTGRAPWWPSGVHLLLYEGFYPAKIVGKVKGWNSAATRQNLGGTNLGLRRSCSAGETSLREGEIITIVITNDPLIGSRSISTNIHYKKIHFRDDTCLSQ